MKFVYLKFVQWSYCPDLFIGGVCHGAEEEKVYRELMALVAAEVTATRRSRRSLPPRAAQVMMPVAV